MPIKPSEIVAARKKCIPKTVFNVIDKLIVTHWNGFSAVVKQEEIIDLLVKRTKKSAQYYFDNNFLDIEDIYREQGWDVIYDRPRYFESYGATFTFVKKDVGHKTTLKGA